MSGCGCVDNVEQTSPPALLISFPPNLSFSRLSSMMVTASPCLTRLVIFVKASYVCGSKQERSTELVKWEKSELTKSKEKLFFLLGGWETGLTTKTLKESTLEVLIRYEECNCETVSNPLNTRGKNSLIPSYSSISDSTSLCGLWFNLFVWFFVRLIL